MKLGDLDLNQSQLLSVKALIESMDAEIAYIDTLSEQTEASAVSHGIIVSKCDNEEIPAASYVAEPKEEEAEAVVETLKEGEFIEVHADIEQQPENRTCCNN